MPLYDSSCIPCHGSDGREIDFDSGTEGVQGVGWLANDNPQETLHKIRWGHPGSAMPSMVGDEELTDEQTGDILAHTQTLPQ
jgi:thiosulfate dehydrogenase